MFDKNLKGIRKFINLGYRRYRLPNLLAILGFKFFRVSKKLSYFLVKSAIFLNPNHPVFWDILKNIDVTSSKSFKKINVSISSIPESCQQLNQKIFFFAKENTLQLTKPKVLNSDYHVSQSYETIATLPNTYVATLDKVLVFGGTDLILRENNCALYDELAHKNKKRYEIKSPIIQKISTKTVSIKYCDENIKVYHKAIHFLKDHSCNYFHWLVECLPRLMLINQLPETKNLPLLVDSNLAQQQLDALNLLNQENRPIHYLAKNECFLVDKLYFPSHLSIIHDNMKSPVCYSEDIIYSPNAMQYIRNQFLNKICPNENTGYKKLYVSRKGSRYRKILNEDELQELMTANGFEIVFPEKLSFKMQVKLFSQAKIVVGQSGAGLANLLFVPNDCQTLIFMSDDKQTNLHVFHAFCDSFGCKVKFLIGKSEKNCSMHSDFTVNLKLLQEYLNHV